MLLPVNSRTAFRDGEFSVNTYVWGACFMVPPFASWLAGSTLATRVAWNLLSYCSKHSEQITQCQSFIFQYRPLRFQLIESTCVCNAIRQACRDKRFYPIALLCDFPLHHLIHRQHVQDCG